MARRLQSPVRSGGRSARASGAAIVAQFDVCRVRGDVLVIDCQSDLLSGLATRLVVPLRTPDPAAPDRLLPVFTIDGRRLAMVTPLARSIAVRDIEGIVANLTAEESRIKAALDMLISGY
nr:MULTISPECIES: CcdB family protein [unclassified Sphingomonas]